MHGDRCGAYAICSAVEADDVADEDRLMKDDLSHGDRDVSVVGLSACFDETGLINVGKQHAAEDGVGGVHVARHHDDADGGAV